MIAGRISSIMPTLTYEERIGISTIYSVCGLLKDGNAVTKRPYRAPHHTITVQGMTGGGRYPRPGELSLASGGVLFLDELPEFNPLVIDTLRQPLENKKITLVRASGKYEFAADCMLVAAMNVVGQKVIQPTIRVASLIGLEGFDNKENGVFLLCIQISKGINSPRLISVKQRKANYYYNF